MTFNATQSGAKEAIFGYNNVKHTPNHVYALYAEIKTDTDVYARFGWRKIDKTTALGTTAINSQTWASSFAVGVVTTTDLLYLAVYLTNSTTSTSASATVQFRNMMCVDLTQYFNGDQTLIDSITSWDDLVAYDSRFASYVEYNTGTVTGVQPTVKVSGKNILDVSVFTTNKNIIVSNGVITTIGYACSSAKKLKHVLHVDNIPEGTQVTVSADVTITAGSRPSSGSTGSVAVLNVGELLPYLPMNAVTGVTYHRTKTLTLTNALLNGTIYFYGITNSSSVTFENLQIELGSSATAYEPYHDGGTAQAPELFAVDNAADEFEAVSGVTTHRLASVDLGTLKWKTGSTQGYFYCDTLTDITLGFCGLVVSSKLEALTVHWSSSDFNSYPDNIIAKTIGNKILYVKCMSFTKTQAAEFKTYVSGAMLYYELATPTTTQSTPTQISLQAGDNVAMQTDGGRLAPIDITYESNEI
jgi:hypothetical protein